MTDIEKANAQEDVRLYELAFNLVPTLEDKIDVAFEGIKNHITKNGGTVTADSAPALIDLAYTMAVSVDAKKQKYNQAYFGWVKFTALPEQLAALAEELDGELDIIRYEIFKTVPEAATSAQDVAQAINSKETLADEEESDDSDDSDETEESTSDEVDTEETKEDTSKEATEDEKKVDEAIDELVEDEE